ncbi:hypothetical protein IMSHALPRED_010182 [Imshaugia aleurites]|uniref:Ketoreductase domain-containing protein n=1 Tax=Imshaugia aleurites TaxID=172621 RepID=A0A8H3G5T9_9LECA|nr:hypothetical protein IMSHALPRED_010182 [Imshaugia aleurites]
MRAPFPSLTETYHNASYDAISPTRPELSVAHKTIIVTGGGRGIGPEIARAYAAAGASRIVLLGRTQSTLSQTAEKIEKEFASVSVSTHTADIADQVAIEHVAEKVQNWDVLILNAGVLASPQPIAKSDPADWWRVLETNVKGAMVTTRAFLPSRNNNASIIGLNANMITVPASYPAAAGASAYVCSKFAQLKLLEYVSAENPDVFVVSVHPGVVDTDMLRSMDGHRKLDPAILDNVELPAHFILWLASKEARFLKGRYVCANWDVEELKGKAEVIESTRILEANVHGWPYGGAMDALLA